MYTPTVEGSEPDSPVFGPALITLLCCESLPLALCVRRVGCLQLPCLDRSAFASTNRLACCGCAQCHASIPAALSCDSAVSPICAAHGMPAGHACAPFFFLVLHVSLLPHTCPRLCECARKYRKMMLQLPDNNRRFAALPAQYSAACDRRLSLFGVSCRGNFYWAEMPGEHLEEPA